MWTHILLIVFPLMLLIPTPVTSTTTATPNSVKFDHQQSLVPQMPDPLIKCGEYCPCVNPCAQQISPPPPPPPPPPPSVQYCKPKAPPPTPRFIYFPGPPGGNLYPTDDPFNLLVRAGTRPAHDADFGLLSLLAGIGVLQLMLFW